METITKQTQALKLLVEALSLYETRTDGLVNKALAAGKEALAQLEQKPKCIGKASALWGGPVVFDPPLAQPKQEPVAMQMDVIVVNLVREGINKHRARELAEHFIKHTTPPPVTESHKRSKERAYKPLTDEQYFEIGQRHWLPSNKIEQIHKEIDEAATASGNP